MKFLTSLVIVILATVSVQFIPSDVSGSAHTASIAPILPELHTAPPLKDLIKPKQIHLVEKKPAVPIPISPKDIGKSLSDAKFGADQWSCLDKLWTKESRWNPTAHNPSGAHGIPQSLPAGKMASHGADYMTNPRVQISWGLDYIAGRFGNPCNAWAHSQAHNWY